MSGNPPPTPQGNMPAIGIPNTQDYARLIFSAPYFEQIPIAEIIQPSVTEAVEAALPALVPPYVDAAAQQAVSQLAVLLTGSTMTGPLFLSPLMPTQPSQAATMAYVDAMIATAGIPEVPPVPSGQVWARETGQWVPITPQTGVFLPLSGGSMTGNINMSGNTIQNMAAVPAMPNGAAPAQWVLNQIASVSLFQGQWDADTNVPDLTQLSVRVNGYTWIAITTSPSGVVVGPAIPGLQGKTVFNGDTIYYSTVDGAFFAIHAGGLTLPEAQSLFVLLAGSQMSGPLLLNANASQPLQAVTLQQMQAFVPPGVVPEAPNDGQLYGRNGLTTSWAPVLPLAGGILTGAVTLAGNAAANLNPVPLQQMNSAITAATAGYLPLAGGTMTGLFNLSGNATGNLNAVPLQQLNSMLGAYAPLSGAAFTGPVTLPAGSSTAPSLNIGGAGLWWNPTTPGQLTLTQSLTVPNIVATTGTMGAIISQAGSTGESSVGGTLQVVGGLTTDTAAIIGGTLTVNGSRILSFGNGTSPSVGAFEQAAGIAAGFWASTGTYPLNLGQLNADASPHTAWGWFDVGGNLTILGTLSQGSDQTNKTNIAPLAQGVSLLNQLIPKSYAWNTAPSVTKWGFIAQDVEGVIPDAVSQGPSQPDGTPGTLSLDITAILAIAVLALKQAFARIVALEANANITPPAADLA